MNSRLKPIVATLRAMFDDAKDYPSPIVSHCCALIAAPTTPPAGVASAQAPRRRGFSAAG